MTSRADLKTLAEKAIREKTCTLPLPDGTPSPVIMWPQDVLSLLAELERGDDNYARLVEDFNRLRDCHIDLEIERDQARERIGELEKALRGIRTVIGPEQPYNCDMAIRGIVDRALAFDQKPTPCETRTIDEEVSKDGDRVLRELRDRAWAERAPRKITAADDVPPCGGNRCHMASDGTWIHSSKSYGTCAVRGDEDFDQKPESAGGG